MAYAGSQSSLGLYNVHYCNVIYSRVKREHLELENGHKAWLGQREKKRRGLITQLDRLNALLRSLDGSHDSPSASKKRKATEATLAKAQAELDEMDREDQESADPETFRRYPYSITCRRPAYRRVRRPNPVLHFTRAWRVFSQTKSLLKADFGLRKQLAYQLAFGKSEARIKKAEEARDLALAQQDVENALQGNTIHDSPGAGSEAPAEQVSGKDAEEQAAESLGATSEPPPVAPGLAGIRQPWHPTFSAGLKIDSFLGRFNGSPGSMTRKVGFNRAPPPTGESSKWTYKWGFHDVRASKFQYTPKT